MAVLGERPELLEKIVITREVHVADFLFLLVIILSSFP